LPPFHLTLLLVIADRDARKSIGGAAYLPFLARDPTLRAGFRIANIGEPWNCH
jgi:hypothetical protein